MSKIKELLKSDDSILVFDIDGVLAVLEFGEYRAYFADDNTWTEEILNGTNFYDETKISKKMQEFLMNKNMNNIYVITKSYTKEEDLMKKEFVKKYYSILDENFYTVREEKDKKEVLNIIKEKTGIEDYKIVMIDDTTSILCDVMDNTNFSTAHISSFLDI